MSVSIRLQDQGIKSAPSDNSKTRGSVFDRLAPHCRMSSSLLVRDHNIMSIDTTFDEASSRNKMRKRKRGAEYGSYVDEDTGEVTTVQTSKQAKRAHQKSGKWYKEPTEAELRAWDREEKRQAVADRAAKREENKKINAAKRAEKERKDEHTKRQMFERGKITFTQTLAKKDEDQKNLHSWFGVRPGLSKLREPASLGVGGVCDENKENKDQDNQHGAFAAVHNQIPSADGETCLNKIKKLSQHGSDHFDEEIDEIEEIFDIVTAPSHSAIQVAEPDQPIETDNMDQFADLIMDHDMIPDFEILEDKSAGDAALDQDTDLPTVNPFKVPALPSHHQSSPKRLPLSPMSRSDVNVRNSQTSTRVSSFKSRLEKADINTMPSTQAVRDVLWGISTQDLKDDLEDMGKENDKPDFEVAQLYSASPVKSTKHSSPLKNVSFASKLGSNPSEANRSFNSNIDPTDYDSIFFELDAAEKVGQIDDHAQDHDDFDDDLDDATLLALPPATQLMAAARSSKEVKTAPNPASNTATVKPTRRPLTKADSFANAFEDLDDDDLIAGLNEYEQTQNKKSGISTAASIAEHTSFKKKGRVLPWERPSWDINGSNAEHGRLEQIEGEDGNDDDDGNTNIGTQDTELLSSFGYGY